VILDWLIGEFRDLFTHDPDAHIVLWFDAKAEFRGLLTEADQAPDDDGITLLALNTEQAHGPLWLKWATEVGPGTGRKTVLWLPCSREAVGAGSDGLRLDVLLEYEHCGLEWRVDGKPPTLFGFLKKHGVPLPANRADQDALWRGGPDSPLARYVVKHAGRDETFWQSRTLSLAVVQEGIVGGVEERLLRFLADPEGELAVMHGEGIVGDFRSQLASELADPAAIEDDPGGWSTTFVTGIALLEVYEMTGKLDDFPFLSKLPVAERRERQLKFLRRWMRDAEFRPKYREWALAVEPSIDVVAWARGRSGRPHALRALVRDRWAAFLSGLQNAGPDDAGQQLYLQEKEESLLEESKGFWAADADDVPGWRLAVDLAGLADAAVRACNPAVALAEPKALVSAYARDWHAIDVAHWRLLAGANRLDDMEAVAKVGDRFYFSYLQCVGQAFYDAFRDGGAWPPAGCRSVREVIGSLYSKPGKGTKKAVLIVDALRYELGCRLAEKLDGAEVEPLIADLPSETWVGMTALTPGCDARLDVEAGGHKLPSAAAAGDLCYSQYRKRLIAAAGAGALPAASDGKPRDQISDVLTFGEQPPGLPELLVLFDRGIDSAGHGLGNEIVHYFDQALDSTRRAIRRLQSWGYSEIHVVTDHGFVLLNSSDAVQKMEVDKGTFADSGNRWGILAKGASAPTAVLPFVLDPEWSVAVPPGIRSFSRPGAFFHGGATLQEVVVPHIVVKVAAGAILRMRVQALLPTVNVSTMTVKVELRPVLPHADNLLDTVQGTAVNVYFGQLASPQSTEKTVEFNSDATDPISVTLFLNREPPLLQGSEVPLQVIDAETGESYATGLFVRAVRDLS
jgi:hypothetical protein